MNGGLRFRSKRENVLESIGSLGGDIASLVELQAKLTAMDLKEAVGRATWPTTTLIIAAVVLVATLPVLLIGLAFVLASAFSISQGAALLITGLIFAVIAGVISAIAGMELVKSLQSFRRSNEELARNVAWIRTVVAQSGKSISR